MIKNVHGILGFRSQKKPSNDIWIGFLLAASFFVTWWCEKSAIVYNVCADELISDKRSIVSSTVSGNGGRNIHWNHHQPWLKRRLLCTF